MLRFRNIPVPVGNMPPAPAGRQGPASRGGEDALGLPSSRGAGAWFRSWRKRVPSRRDPPGFSADPRGTDALWRRRSRFFPCGGKRHSGRARSAHAKPFQSAPKAPRSRGRRAAPRADPGRFAGGLACDRNTTERSHSNPRQRSNHDDRTEETRPGYIRATLDIPTPLHDRRSRYVEALKTCWGTTEQGVCRALLDDGLTRAGHPPKANKG